MRESLRERARLLALAPGMVEPLEFLLPVYAGDARPLWMVRAGLSVYDALSSGDRHRALDAGGAAAAAALRTDGLRGGVAYRDARCLPERLALANLLDAAAAGAVVLNYVEAVRLLVESGRARGAVVRDLLGGGEAEVRARVTVNAAGPWAEEVVARAGLERPRLLRPVRGAHVAVTGLPLDRAVAATADDGRLVFAVPWGATTLLGTTETEDPGDPAEAAAAPDEVAYLLRNAARLFPRAEATPVHTYAGIRNLVAARGAAAAVPRDSRLALHAGAAGLVSVLGGKLTTYRALAERLVDRVGRDLGVRGSCRTAERPLPAPPFDPRALSDIEAAARASARAEWVRRLGDFVFRRTWIGFHPEARRAHLEAAAAGCGEALGWDAGRRRAEIAAVEAEAAQRYGRRVSG